MDWVKNRTFSEIWNTLEDFNEDKEKLSPDCKDMLPEEYTALIGRYAESEIAYENETQFKCAFLTIYREAVTKLRLKLKVNDRLREMDENEALNGEKEIINEATNPDTEPPTEDFEALPYINSQRQSKRTLGTVSGLYFWKHSSGGQAYNEFLEGFRDLFVKILPVKEEYYYKQRR